MKPFRFGIMPYVGFWRQPMGQWVESVKLYEKLGYDTVFQCDHFYKDTYDPIAMLASAAAATRRLHVGTLVFDVDYRHPVVLAKAGATLHLLSGGRFEFGIGAGWQKRDYVEAGIPFDRPGKRIERLEEALTIIRGMWTQEKTSFEGKHYNVAGIDKAGDLPEGERPKIIVGGGGRKVLSVAGRHADIVGINLSVSGGDLVRSVRRQTLDRVKRQTEWALGAAEECGRETDEIQLQMHVPWIRVTDEPEAAYMEVAGGLGITVDEAYACPKVLFGSCSEIRGKLRELRDETGITYFSLGLSDDASIREFAESVMKPMRKAH
ncbi:TIGR03621 family F420-dependent LLM class oxidoreductase [Candidatus Bathyarchaeota archaeon]|nr:TIGR03621 family F420-dependent LLM class oxidoreductase [Candidatus Bathyarchaeota archaeon]